VHIKSIQVRSYKRFTDLTICDLPETARLVVVTGPNGCGKSSLFDAFKTWQSIQGIGGPGIEPLYHYKQNQIMPNHNELSTIAFHEPLPSNVADRKKMFYIRSAYRNQYSGPRGAPFNDRRCCSKEPHMSTGVTGEQRAFGCGTTGGAKPADNAWTLQATTGRACNPCDLC